MAVNICLIVDHSVERMRYSLRVCLKVHKSTDIEYETNSLHLLVAFDTGS